MNRTSAWFTGAFAVLEKRALPLFYLVPPSHSYYESLDEIPDYLKDVVPFFILFILVEMLIRWLQKLPALLTNDSIGSMSAGLIMSIMSNTFFTSLQIAAYIWVYENYRLVTLPWDSPITWWIMFFGVDLGYYWFHRMAHEINLFWAAHQVHHSSEYYNLTTALRQSALQRFTSWFFYLPLAFAVPPTQYVVHKQFNLLYQFWIHTEIVGKLGPLEWILNTPSHHRVHHGRNRYCIDKNYAGVLIIWDRIFGTFEPEQDKVIYGLVHPLESFNPIWIQFHHVLYLINKTWETEGITNKLSVLFKGPGWIPGTGRLGDPTQVPVTPVNCKPYNKRLPLWVNYYTLMHFILVLAIAHFLQIKQAPYVAVLVLVAFFIVSLTSFGFIFDQKSLCAVFEITRLSGLVLADLFFPLTLLIHPSLLNVVRPVYATSILVWAIVLYRQLTTTAHKIRKD